MQYLKKFISMLWGILPHATLIAIGVFLWWYLNTAATSSMPLVNSVASGIISGLVTAFLLFVFAILWKQNITPWFENLLYQDVCIEEELPEKGKVKPKKKSGEVADHEELSDTEKDKFRIRTFNKVMDQIVSSLDSRFSANKNL